MHGSCVVVPGGAGGRAEPGTGSQVIAGTVSSRGALGSCSWAFAVGGELRQRRGWTLAAAIGLSLGQLACGSGETLTVPLVATEITFDVDLALDFILVTGACEDDPDDPGEFVYRVRLEAPRQSSRFATEGFPDEGGAVTHHEGVSYPLGAQLLLRSVPLTDADRVVLRFTASELDGGTADARMALAETLTDVPPGTGRSERTISARVGEDTGCQLLLSARAAWTFDTGR